MLMHIIVINKSIIHEFIVTADSNVHFIPSIASCSLSIINQVSLEQVEIMLVSPKLVVERNTHLHTVCENEKIL